MRSKQINTRSADYQKLQVLKTNRNKRYRYGEFLVEGVRNLNEAMKNGWEFSSLLYGAGANLSDWATDMLKTVKTQCNYQLAPELLAELSGKEDTSELLAVVRMKPDDPARLTENLHSDAPVFVLFDRPSNRGNLGTILRSCDSFGADGLILTGHGVDLYDPEVVGASMGSFFHVPAVRMTDNAGVFRWIDEMKSRFPGFQVVGTTSHKQYPIDRQDLTGPVLLMIGNETDGLCYAFKEKSDILCTIPMAETSSASSLNVACAATVLLYEASRQRGGEKTAQK